MTLNLFHALRRRHRGKPDTAQTDRPKTTTSGDSRERPAFDIFDWRTVPDVDPDELAMWRSRTDAKERQFPLQVALQVHDELERELMAPTRLDALRLSEIRGGIKALARFAQVYSATMTRGATPLRPERASECATR